MAGAILSIGEALKVWVQVPGYPGWDVLVQYLTPAKVKLLSEDATTKKLNRQTRQMEDKVDNEILAKLMTKAMILDWRGLTTAMLRDLVPVPDAVNAKLEKEHGGKLPFSPEDLEVLVENTYSRSFMDTVMECATDLHTMREMEKRALEKNSGA